MKTILVIDDEKNYLLVLATLLGEEGYNVVTCDDPHGAVRMVEEESPQLVITDLKMPGLGGIELLKLVRQKRPELPVIVMTAFGTIETAVEAMRQGAYHYILKPFNNEELKLVVKRAIEVSELRAEKGLLRKELSSRLGFDELVCESEAMKGVSRLIEQVAPERTTVLIQGASGTGKELVARLIHNKSPRSAGPFIAVNCGALAESLLESELFGYEKGAFTGAASRKKGRFEMADRGTLFLDEVASTSQALQVRLLRVLQEQSFERVGGTKPVSVDVRVVAASNRDLSEMVREGAFREDLFYRLNVFTIDVSPLSDRKEDVMPLAGHFLRLFSTEMGKRVTSFSGDAALLIQSYNWPGNVRELRNVVERAVVVAAGESITASDLPAELSTAERPSMPAGAGDMPEGTTLPALVEGFEKGLIKKALEESGGVQARAARRLGISPTSLQYKLGKYGL